MKRPRDTQTLDLFDIPAPITPAAGMLDLDCAVREALSDAMKRCDGDRWKVAADMGRLTGRDISKYMLDAYTGDSRSDHNFPLRYAAAFEVATNSFCLMTLLSKARGCRSLVGEESLLAELGRIEQKEIELRAQKQAIRAHLEKRK